MIAFLVQYFPYLRKDFLIRLFSGVDANRLQNSCIITLLAYRIDSGFELCCSTCEMINKCCWNAQTSQCQTSCPVSPTTLGLAIGIPVGCVFLLAVIGVVIAVVKYRRRLEKAKRPIDAATETPAYDIIG